MGVTENYRNIEGKINPTKNGPRLIMNSEINSCPRKPWHEKYYYIINKSTKITPNRQNSVPSMRRRAL